MYIPYDISVGFGHLSSRTKSKIIRLAIANQIVYFFKKIFGDLSGKIQKSSETSRGTKLGRNGGMAPRGLHVH